MKNSAKSIQQGQAIESVVGKVKVPDADKILCGCKPGLICIADQHTGLLAAVNPPRDSLAAKLCAEPTVTKAKDSPNQAQTLNRYDLEMEDFNVKTSTGRRANQLQQKCSAGSPCPNFPQAGYSKNYEHLKQETFSDCEPCNALAQQLGQQYLDKALQTLGEGVFNRTLDLIQVEMNNFVAAHPEYTKCVAKSCLCAKLPEGTKVNCPSCEQMLSCVEEGSPEYMRVLASEEYIECNNNCLATALSYANCTQCAHLEDDIDSPEKLSAYLQCVLDSCALAQGRSIEPEDVCKPCSSFYDATNKVALDGYEECASVRCDQTQVDPSQCSQCNDHIVMVGRVVRFYSGNVDAWFLPTFNHASSPLIDRMSSDSEHLNEWVSENPSDLDLVIDMTWSQWQSLEALAQANGANLSDYFEWVHWHKKSDSMTLVNQGAKKLIRNTYDHCFSVNCMPEGQKTDIDKIQSPVTFTVSGSLATVSNPSPKPDFVFCHACLDHVDLVEQTYLPTYDDCRKEHCKEKGDVACCQGCEDFVTSDGQFLDGYYECYLKNCATDFCVCPQCKTHLEEYGIDSHEWRSCYLANCMDYCCECDATKAAFGIDSIEYVNCVRTKCPPPRSCQEVFDDNPNSLAFLHCLVYEMFKGQELCQACCRFDKETQLSEFLACVEKHCNKNIVEPICDALGVTQATVEALTDYVDDNTQTDKIRNYGSVCLIDPSAASKLRSNPNVQVKHSAKLVLIDGASYLEDVFYFPKTDKEVTKRTKIQSEAEVRNYLRGKFELDFDNLPPSKQQQLVSEMTGNLKDVQWILKNEDQTPRLTTSYKVESICDELERSRCCTGQELPEFITDYNNKCRYDAQRKMMICEDSCTRIEVTKDDEIEYVLIDKITEDRTVLKIKDEVQRTWDLIQYEKFVRVAQISQETIEKIIEGDPCIQEVLRERRYPKDSQEARDFVKYDLILGAQSFIEATELIQELNLDYSGVCLEDLTESLEEIRMNPEVIDSIESTLPPSKEQVVEIPAIDKYPDAVQEVKVSENRPQQTSQVSLFPSNGLEVIIPAEVIEAVQEAPNLELVEEHLAYLKGKAKFISEDYIKGLRATLVIPSSKVPVEAIENITPDDIKSVVETIIPSDSPLKESLLFGGGFDLVIEVKDDGDVPGEVQSSLRIEPEFDLTDEVLLDVVSAEHVPSIKEALEALSKAKIMEVPVDTFVWTDDEGKVTLTVKERGV